MINIIILGHINSGKSVISKYLVEKYNFQQFALGDCVKEFVIEMMKLVKEEGFSDENIKIEDLYDRSKKERYRSLMQKVSTDLVKKFFGQDIWINIVKEKIKKNNDSNLVINDIRFKNEFNAFNCVDDIDKSNRKVISIRVVRKGKEIYSDHISEHDVDNVKVNYTIYNDGSIEDLYSKIDNIMLRLNVI